MWEFVGYRNRFGCSVSTAGDVNGDGYSDIVVGAYNYSYSWPNPSFIFIFLGSPLGVDKSPDLKIYDGVGTDQYGHSVSCAGDINGDGYSDVIVGAPHSDDGIRNQGRAYVYLGSRRGLNSKYVWRYSGGQEAACLGYRVSTAGDVNGDGYSDFIIGAPYYDNGEDNEGRVFLFLGSAYGIPHTPDWTAEINVAGACFGSSLAAAGDVNGDGYADVIIGAENYSNGQSGEGAAFVYLGSSTGLMDEPHWSKEGEAAGARFGYSVASAGDIDGDGYCDVIIGEPEFSELGYTTDGRVFVFRGSPEGLEENASWGAAHLPNYQYGYCVSPAGDVNGDGFSDVIVGSNPQAYFDLGIVHVYTGTPNGLSETPSWAGNEGEGAQTESFGKTICAAGDVNGDGLGDIIVGDPEFSYGRGRAFIYLGVQERTSLRIQWEWKADGHQDSGWFGHSTANAGDVNGDGYSDVIVGEFLLNAGHADAGAAHIYLGGASGLNAVPSWTTTGTHYGEWFGYSVASAGDVNCDGFADVIVGAPNYSNGEGGEGGVFLYLGSKNGTLDRYSWFGEGNEMGSAYGASIAGVGDVNKDGYNDVVVGAYRHCAEAPEAGCAYLYLGSPWGLRKHPAWTAAGEEGYAWFGYAVSGAGDVNRDGFSDVIVGAPSNGGGREGRAYLFLGTLDGLQTQPMWTGRRADVFGFGGEVASAGDVNGDGYWDILVAANSDILLEASEERIFVYHGRWHSLEQEPQWTFTIRRPIGCFKVSAAAVGDIDGDGFDDVAVGDYLCDSWQTETGRALVFRGSQQGLAAHPAWTLSSKDSSSWFGYSVAAGGDINGDGTGDILIGAPRSGDSNKGAVYAYVSGGCRTQCIPRQLRLDGSAPVQAPGLSYGKDGFRLSVKNPYAVMGGNIALELEVKYHSAPFNGTGIRRIPFVNWNALERDENDDRVLSAQVTGLSNGKLFHWRLRVATDSPYYPHGPWLANSQDPILHGDIRTGIPPLFSTDLPVVVDTSGNNTESPLAFSLNAAHPNPFQPATTIEYSIPAKSHVTLVVYDVRGCRVRTLVHAEKNPGLHRNTWNGLNDKGTEVGSGVYFIRLEANGLRKTRKVVRIR